MFKDIDIKFVNKEITPFGGLSLFFIMLEKCGFQWYTKAADQGVLMAQYNLGLCYQNGTGVAQDYEQAVRLYTPLAKRGFASAQYNMAV